MKTSSQPNDPEFAATERAYGGAKGYAQALAAGRTKLTYQQWIQVRTPAFKEWFGNWEGGTARLQSVALELAGWSGSASELSTLAREVYTKELQGSTINNASLGAPVAFSAEGKGEAFGARGKLRNPARAELVRVLRDVVGCAVAVAQETPKKNREVDTRSFHTLVAPLSVNDQVCSVKVTVREALKVPQGDAAHKFYDVTSIEIGRSPDVHGLDGTEVPSHPAPVEASSFMIADLAKPFNLNVKVDPASISKAIDPVTGEPLVLYRSVDTEFSTTKREHPKDDAPFQKTLFFTANPTPSSDMAHPVFLNARTLDGEMDHIHDGNAWLVLDPAKTLSAAGNSYPLGRDDPTTVKANLSAGDQPMANPIKNESTVYGEPRQTEPDNGAVRETPPDWTTEDAFLANELLVDDDRQQSITSPAAPAKTPDSPAEKKPETQKRAKKAKSAAPSSPAPKAEKPKRARTTKAKEKAASTPEPAAPQPAPSPAPAPKGIEALDPHASQRLDRVASNRAADLVEVKKKLDSDAMNRARIHLLQDPTGRHIVAIDLGGVTKAYAVDESPGIAAKTVNTLREGMRKLGGLASEIGFLPDVIKTRFRLKSGEEKIAYNVDPEGVDPRHPHMREAGLGENDRRNLVVIPDGNPDEITKKVLLSTDLPDDVKKRFVYSDTVPGQYYDRSRKLAFIDKGSRLATDQNTPEIIASMVSIAQAKGWKAITVKGHEDFQREAWLAASLAGIEVKGFKPKEPDIARLEYERQVRMNNAIQAAAPTPTPVANEISSPLPEKQSPEISPEAVALGEVARLKGVREDQIPNFVKAAQDFIDQAKRTGIDLPALKIFDPKAPSAPAVATPDKTREQRSIDNPHPDKAPKR